MEMRAPDSKPAAAILPEATQDTRARREAGAAFEALFIERMLSAASQQTSGPAADWRSLADRAIARDMARSSPLGLAKLLDGQP